jgi:hypothetical protein
MVEETEPDPNEPPAPASETPPQAEPPPVAPPSNVPMASPPPIPPPSSAPAPTPTTTRPAPQVTPALILIVLGAVVIIVSLFLHWFDINITAAGKTVVSRAGNGHTVSVQFLFDNHTSDDDPSILIILIPAVALGLLGAALHQKVLAFIGSIASLLVAGLFIYQVKQGIDELNDKATGVVHISLGDFMGIAPYVCGIGAIIMLVGAFLDRRPRADVTGAAALPPPAIETTQ